MTPISYTERGFADFAKFTDSYGNDITVRESSNADGPHLWIFVVGEAHLLEQPRAFAGVHHGIAKASASTHMDLEQVTKLRDSLSEFIEFSKTRWATQDDDS